MERGRMEINLNLLPLPLQDGKDEPEIYGAIIPHVRVPAWPVSECPRDIQPWEGTGVGSVGDINWVSELPP